jgi:hypothetical protein
LCDDIGDPVGFKMAAALLTRVRSLTIFNTRIQADHFRRPGCYGRSCMAAGRRTVASHDGPAAVCRAGALEAVTDRSVPAVELAAHLDLAQTWR